MRNRVHVAAMAAILIAGGGSARATDFGPGPRPAGFSAGDRFAAPVNGLQQLRRDVAAARKQAVAQNLRLTESEAERFWPVYDQFAAEFMIVFDRKLALLAEYGRSYGAITDQDAERYLAEEVAIEESASELRTRYIPLFHKVLSGRGTALFYQVERRISLLIELDLAAQVPLIEP